VEKALPDGDGADREGKSTPFTLTGTTCKKKRNTQPLFLKKGRDRGKGHPPILKENIRREKVLTLPA